LFFIIALLLVGIAPRAALAWAPTRIGGRVAERGDSSLIFVGRRPDGSVDFGYKASSDLKTPGAWSSWQPLGGVLSSQPVTVVNANNKVAVLGRGTDNRFYFRQEIAANSNAFADWTAIEQPGVPGLVGDPALVRLGDGRLSVFGTGSDGAIYQSTQVSQGGAWSSYSSLGSPANVRLTKSPVVAISANGALVVFAQAVNLNDNALWIRQQSAAGGPWMDWVSLGWRLQYTKPADAIAVNYDALNRLTVVVNNAGATVSSSRQKSANSTTWTPWVNTATGRHGGSRPAAPRNDDGRITVFFAANDNGTMLSVQRQTAPGADTWTDWTEYTQSNVSSSPVAITDVNGRIHVFALDNSSMLHEAVQMDRNSDVYTDWSTGYINEMLSGL
jgi:hypothetical protein